VRSIEENGNERRRKQGGVYWVISWGGQDPRRKGAGEQKVEEKGEGKVARKEKKDAEVGRME